MGEEEWTERTGDGRDGDVVHDWLGRGRRGTKSRGDELPEGRAVQLLLGRFLDLSEWIPKVSSTRVRGGRTEAHLLRSTSSLGLVLGLSDVFLAATGVGDLAQVGENITLGEHALVTGRLDDRGVLDAVDDEQAVDGGEKWLGVSGVVGVRRRG